MLQAPQLPHLLLQLCDRLLLPTSLPHTQALTALFAHSFSRPRKAWIDTMENQATSTKLQQSSVKYPEVHRIAGLHSNDGCPLTT